MKKITFVAALLGSVYFSNAQVGIGTPTPATSSMLDITASDRGVLIPRVNLSSLTVFSPVTGTEVNGLLVFATGEKIDTLPVVESGFYYWNVSKWERIVSQTQLDTVIGNQADIAKIKALLDAAYGSNNLGETPSTGTHGGMVYTPEIPAIGTQGQPDYVAAVPAKIEYVTWNGTTYVKQDATDGLISLIQGNETKTKIVTVKNVQYYLSETFDKFSNLASITQPGVNATPAEIAAFEDAKEDVLDSAVEGSYFKIDVVGGVVNNFNDIITSTTVIEGTSQTIEQYFQSLGADSNTVYFNNTNASLTIGNGSVAAYTFYLKDAAGNPVEIDLADLISNLEAVTTLVKSTGANTAPIVYTYSNENVIKGVVGATATQITITADIISSITNNTDVQNAITNMLNASGNVYYGDHDGVSNTADVFYTIVNNVKTPIDLSNVVVNATTINAGSTTEQINNVTKIKQNLGDSIVNNTSVFTGDTITISGVTYYIYKGEFNTAVTANTAVTTGITLDKKVIKILSMNLRYAGGVSANVTNLVTSGTDDKEVAFNIGTGNMYQVLGTSNVDAKVIVEFASDVSPLIQ